MLLDRSGGVGGGAAPQLRVRSRSSCRLCLRSPAPLHPPLRSLRSPLGPHPSKPSSSPSKPLKPSSSPFEAFEAYLPSSSPSKPSKPPSSSPFEAFEAFVLTFEAFEAFVLTLRSLRSLPPFSPPPPFPPPPFDPSPSKASKASKPPYAEGSSDAAPSSTYRIAPGGCQTLVVTGSLLSISSAARTFSSSNGMAFSLKWYLSLHTSSIDISSAGRLFFLFNIGFFWLCSLHRFLSAFSGSLVFLQASRAV